MKQMFENARKMLAVFLCLTVVAILAAAPVCAEEIEEAAMEQLVLTGEGLTDTIIALSEEEIGGYANSTDSFTLSAMSAWEGSREELGEVLPEESGETTVVKKGNSYTVTVPRVFEKAKANFVYIFNRTMDPESVTIDVKLPMGLTLSRAGLNTLMGILIVFVILIFLSFVISLLKYVPGLVGKKGETRQAPAPVASAPAPVPASAQEEELADDMELVAVVAAAIAAAEGTSPDGFVVRSIRRANRRR